MNFGVRWDWFGPVTDAQAESATYRSKETDIKTIGGFEAPMLVPNPNVRQQLYDINWKQFMPRLGIAYRLTKTTVLRMGSGKLL